MPNHLHVLFMIGSAVTLERAMQFIKGGFSHRAGKHLEMKGEIWQRGSADQGIRDAIDFAYHRECIRQNPIRARLAESPENYAYSSAFPGFALDDTPQGLKPKL